MDTIRSTRELQQLIVSDFNSDDASYIILLSGQLRISELFLIVLVFISIYVVTVVCGTGIIPC